MNKLLSILLALSLVIPAAASAQDGLTWRQVESSNLVYLDIVNGDVLEGTVIIELNHRFAPKTASQFAKLVRDDFYRGLSFYRVIDGFVAQGGDESDIGDPNAQTNLPAEFEIEIDEETDLPWVRVELRDMFQAETGFTDGFAAARDGDRAWLTHCPGVVAMARGNEPDSGSTDFYIVIGQAPRYLDRNLAVFGRVVHGMEVVQRIRRGLTEENGIISNETARSRIRLARMGDDLPAEERRDVYVMDTNSEGFEAFMDARRNREHEFFHHTPPRVLDVCQVPVASRIEKADSLNPPDQ